MRENRFIDRNNRTINYLRISLTDRCNLRCAYCMPEEGIQCLPHPEILTYEEILRLARLAVRGGIRKVRLTGGEPLVRRGVLEFVRRLGGLEGLEVISLTTNGVLLADFAEDLRACGVSRVNISLDSLDPERYARITRRDAFHRVLEGLREAERVGFKPIKINVVAMRGVNDDEILDFARLSLEKPYHVRFIEFMPVGMENGWTRDRFISTDEIRDRLSRLGPLRPQEHRDMDGPAERFVLEGAKGEIGFIGALSHHFCSQCNRLRLTSAGTLRGCLFSDEEIDVKTPLRSGASDEVLAGLIQRAIETKPAGHGSLLQSPRKCSRPMSTIGG
ncbi:MAG: GTP 3',8-cyclase MoaA [Deltaproteobacteria bacterium]|nr:GTP 3',8-cyclase MoaA [Deltaproteobacteria bacterium]